MPFYKTLRPFLFLFFWFNFAAAQNYPVNNFNATNELPNNTIRSLLVDSNNILWIGTDNGVVKKENDEFKYFFEEDGLALNSCWAIAEDKNGNLWFGSYGEGLSIYDGFNFKTISEADGLVHNEIIALVPIGNFMYVGTSDGISRVNINTFEIVSLDNGEKEELFRVPDFFEFKDEVYVVSYPAGIFKILNKNQKVSLEKVNDHNYIYSILIENDSIYSSNKGFFTKSALSAYVAEKDFLPSERLGKSIIWEYAKTTGDRIYAAAWGIYDANGGIYEIVGDEMVSRASEFNIPSKEVISLAYDPEFEKLYVGTRDAGLFEVSLDPLVKFHEVEDSRVLGFARTDSTTAVLLADAIVLKASGEEKKIRLSQLKDWQQEYVTSTKLPLPKHKDDFYELDYSTRAQDIRFYDIKSHQGVYWVNTNIGIFAINTSAGLEHYLPLHSEEINFTPDGNLIETNPYGGVRVYTDLKTFKYSHYGQEDPETPTMVVGSLQKGGKTYFLSVFSGLYVWENGAFTSYLKKGIWKEEKLRHITDLGRYLAISSEFGDVFIVKHDEAFEVVRKIPRAKINGNTISFLEGYQETLIIGTERGLTLQKGDRYIFLDGEQGLEQPLISAEVSGDTLAIGSRNGFYTIDLQALGEVEKRVDQIQLKEVVVNNQNLPLAEMDPDDELELAHNENSILLKFSTNAHPYPNKLKYQYRLNPNDPWSLQFSTPEIFLPSLPPEDYRLEVRVLDESTGFSYRQPLLDLIIFPPFWKTWWFAALLFAVIALAVYSVYTYELRQAKRFEEQKGLIQKRFEETKMEALLAQMNPHFIFNAMNSIQYYIVDHDIEKATGFLGDFSKLIRLNLDHCTKPTILLIEEIEYLQAYIRVENTRFNNRIKVKFDVDPAIDPYELEIPTMILQTFVENVFVHAFPPTIENPELKVSFKLLPNAVLQCKVEDNGIGFSNATTNDLHESKGVSLVKERLALLGYQVEDAVQITSGKNKGTTVILNLKV